jgi:hypothetical protein
MATVFFSDQERQRTGTATGLPRKFTAVEVGGRLSVVLFRAGLPMSGLELGDTIQLARLPAAVAIVAGGWEWTVAHPAAVTSLGIAGAPQKFGSSTATRVVEWYLPPHVLDGEQAIIATNAGASWRAGAVVAGHLFYVSA